MAEVVPAGVLPADLDKRFRDAENKVIEELSGHADSESVVEAVENAGWSNGTVEYREARERRSLVETLLQNWLDSRREGSYGDLMSEVMGEELWGDVSIRIKALLDGRTVSWQSGLEIITARKS